MIKVKLTYPFNWPIIKQTPHRSGVWGNCIFYINEEIDECDYWVVFEGLQKKENTKCPSENTLLITAEPPTIKTYHTDFLNQFNWVLTSHNFSRKNVVHSQQALNWMVGGKYQKSTHSWAAEYSKDYDELSAIDKFKKTKLISIVASNKSLTDGHKARLKFIDEAKSFFGKDLDVFGVGFNEIPDKWEAIYPYKYHIALENSLIKNYWTEKIADSFLGGAYPFYHGCPNIEDYFHPNSLTRIDIFDYEKSLTQISNCIKEDKYEVNCDFILSARDLVLNKYNLMSVIGDFCESNLPVSASKKKLSILPEKYYLEKNRFSLKRIKSLFK